MATPSSPSGVALPSGIKEDDQGNRYVGGSVRSDGTVRKVFKVRPGFTPTEDVARYVPVGRRRLQESGEKQGDISPAPRKASPHITNINKILQGRATEMDRGQLRKPDETKKSAPQLEKSESDYPALPGRSPVKEKENNDLVDSLAKLTIDKSQKSTVDGKIKQKLETTSSTTSNALQDVKPEAKSSDTISKSSPADSQPSKDSTASKPKYIPPWKR